MQARFYLPMYGRFASPDPARDQHIELTQSWNIYSYVRNMPTMRIDPTGLYTWGRSLGGSSSDEDLLRTALNTPVNQTNQALDMLVNRTDVRAGLSEIDSKIDNCADPSVRSEASRSRNAIETEGLENGVSIVAGQSGQRGDVGVTNTIAQKSGVGVHEIGLSFGQIPQGGMGQALEHEGTHVADRKEAIGLGNSARGMWKWALANPQLNPTKYSREFKASSLQLSLFGSIYGVSPAPGQSNTDYLNNFLKNSYGVTPENQDETLWP